MVEVLSPIWLEIPETARRILQRVGAVLDFAHIKGWLADEVSLRSVRKGLPRQTAKSEHLEAMPYADVPALMQKLAAGSAIQRLTADSCQPAPLMLIGSCRGNVPSAILR